MFVSPVSSQEIQDRDKYRSERHVARFTFGPPLYRGWSGFLVFAMFEQPEFHISFVCLAPYFPCASCARTSANFCGGHLKHFKGNVFFPHSVNVAGSIYPFLCLSRSPISHNASMLVYPIVLQYIRIPMYQKAYPGDTLTHRDYRAVHYNDPLTPFLCLYLTIIV